MISAGCIGTGKICRMHLQYLKSREDVEIAALCDINKDNLDLIGQEFGGETFTDLIVLSLMPYGSVLPRRFVERHSWLVLIRISPFFVRSRWSGVFSRPKK